MILRHDSPLLCIFCRHSACYEELPVCQNCLHRFFGVLDKKCINCGKAPSGCDCPNSDKARFLFFYEGHRAKQLMYFVKSNVDKVALRYLSELLFKNCGLNPKRYDAVTFVPRRKRAIRRYGHDQAKEIAKAISEIYKIPFVKTLERVGGGEQKLLSADARYKNIKKKYKLTEEASQENKFKRILLVDDVYTTGATIKACSELLRGSVADSVVPIVLAKTNYRAK